MTTQEQLNNDLIKAAKEGNLANIKLLIKQGADIHSDYDEALRSNAANGHLETVKYLVEHGADINLVLANSAYYGHLKVVKYIIENGADIHSNDDGALKWSAYHGYLEIVKYLIIDCNMAVKEETVEYLEGNQNHLAIMNLIKSRDLHKQLDNDLRNNIIDKQSKKKI
jgi:ankyrin repeat protein